MITKDLYLRIKRIYGHVASWAVWGEVADTPKSNMGDISFFDIEDNTDLLQFLRNDVVMVGLNFSRDVHFTEPFQNFHDPSPHANDFKIRYAFKNTQYYGAYMTDVIKDSVFVSSRNLRSYLIDNPSLIKKNIDFFQNELNDIEATKPLLLAFGGDAYSLLKRYLNEEKYSQLIKITHYSHFISKEDYKIDVLNTLKRAGLDIN